MEYKDLILDMLNRIAKLEKEVELLKNEKKLFSEKNTEILSLETPGEDLERPQQRDKTRYMFNGNIYLKNKLVLAVVKDYVSKNIQITCYELKSIFTKSLQGSIGVVEEENIAKQRKDFNIRFFCKEDEVLRLVDGNMLVCSQWGILNISNFIKRAEQLGYEIEQIVRE